MNNFYFLIAILLFFIPAESFNDSSLRFFGQPSSSTSPFIDQRQSLSRALDSLDLEKQSRKRNALPIDEIEHLQSKLLDSLKLINNTIQNTDSKSQTFFSDLGFLSLFIKPSNAFDWVFLSVAALAILSSIFLFSGILSFFLRKKNIQKKSKSKEVAPKKSSTNLPLLAALKPEFPETFATRDLKQKVSNTPLPPSSKENSTISLQIPKIPNPADSLETRVIQAAKNGMEIGEISRQLHLSSSHVSLILKVSENKRS